MAKFNRPEASVSKTVNLAGGVAFQSSAKLELVSLLLTSLLQPQYYRSAEKAQQDLVGLLDRVEPLFAAKAALVARDQFHMRSVSHVVAGELAERAKGAPWLRRFMEIIIVRPDDMMEIAAYHKQAYGRTMTHAMESGFRHAFDQFSDYSLAKYKGAGKEFSLVDIVNLVHPRPRKNNAKALSLLVKSQLAATDTWEAMLTKAGQEAETEEEKQELKADAWRTLLREKKLKTMAAVRNCRNILEQAPDVIDELCSLLTDREEIKKSRMFPFRYLTAIKELADKPGATRLINALSVAADIACEKGIELEGTTLVVLDRSGSMNFSFSQQSKLTVAEVGAFFTAMLAKSVHADIMVFSDQAEFVSYNPRDSATTLANALIASMESGGTNFHAPFELLMRTKRKYDRLFILSDMQGWMTGGFGQQGGAPTSTFAQYRAATGANPKVYSWNLAAQDGGLMFPERNTYCLAGWSDKALELIKLLEGEGTYGLVKSIENREF